MSTILQTDVLALADIQMRLAEQLKANQEQAAQLQAELVDQQVKLSQCQVRAQQVRSEISQWQTQHRANELDVKRAQQDLAHAKGSSLEASRMERLAAADSALSKSKHELAVLVTALEQDTRNEQALVEQVAAITAKLTDLAATRDELAAASSRLSLELCASLLAEGEDALATVLTERERLAAATAQADVYHDQVMTQTALKLAAIDERAALDFLAQHIRVDDPPVVVDVQAQVERAKEAHATAERSRAQSGDDVLPTIQGYAAQVSNLLARIEELRGQHREHAARALLRQMAQPAPVVPDDLAEAQALHAQAQVQANVVVEEAPAREKRQLVTPVRGMRMFGALGTVPTPEPSLLNPKVRE